MSSRNVLFSLALAGLIALPLSPARAAVAPVDSTAVSAPADTTEAKPEAKEQVKEEIKEEAKKQDAKTDAKKSEAKKSAKKVKANAKAEAKAAEKKGTVKSVETAAKPGTMPVKPETAPQRVQVQHILIGFSGSVPGKMISRSKDDAKKLAYEVLERARKGEDFDELVRKYTDDSPPGIYGMCEKGLQPAAGEYPRDGMVAAFGNVGFNISPGNIGIADYDPAASPFGYHIIKRLK
jgi:parvulin-like peptidyl-prolyl isomerase